MRVSFVMAALTLAACDQQRPAKSVALVQGDIMATAPAGYCIDPATSTPANGFAVMAPCATLGGRDPAPDVLGVATVQVGAAASGTVAGEEETLRNLMQTAAGAQLLSNSGDANQIEVLDTKTDENTVTVHFRDDGTPPVDGMGNEEWRAFTDIGGRLVTVAVRGLAAAPMDGDTGTWLLGRVVNGLVPTRPGESPET
ncbi:dihydroxy-acid dehydratase [Yoonia sp. 2307UL14-13]|uniref:dihydroxy-acid dehydratase n=1 Tax=Yoonia sp. 2307UL14-13 TaxID=3126506 RepID=UPI0030A00126